MSKGIVEIILMDRSPTDIEVPDSSNPGSTVRPEIMIFTHQLSGIISDTSWSFHSIPITGKKIKAMIRRIRRKHKRKTMKADKGHNK